MPENLPNGEADCVAIYALCLPIVDFAVGCRSAGYLKNGCALYLQPGLQCSRIFDGDPGGIGFGGLYGGVSVVQYAVPEVV